MCGIVSFYGRSHGVKRVLNALELLAYRAPDSSGIGVLAADGTLAVRKAVGISDRLQALLMAYPLPPLSEAKPQVVVGHGRWAMVGAVTEANAHPICDRSRSRLVCENGSHNASLMLGAFAEQAQWWRARGVPHNEPVHRTENTSEVLAYEWERQVKLQEEKAVSPESESFVQRMDTWGIADVEERGLRLAMWRLQEGNAHACAFFSRHRPHTLYVTSHNKPIAIVTRTHPDGQQEVMVASDVNAALMLWAKPEVETAVARISHLRTGAAPAAAIETILDQFTVSVVFLDNDLHRGEQLFARISHHGSHARMRPRIEITHYDGTPVAVKPRPHRLNPAMVGKGDFPSYTEAHIAEIPDVMDRIVAAYRQNDRIHLGSVWQDGQLFAPGLNLTYLQERFGPRLERLRRIMLIGEGSSRRDAQAAAPLFRELLPQVLTIVYRPVRVLNLAESVDPAHDLAIEISWSGTTDSLLKVDGWLAEKSVLRLAVTGRSQSDLGRRTAVSGGTIDVHTGVEVSVATVKGYQGILMTLALCALQLAGVRHEGETAVHAQLTDECTLVIPAHVRTLVTNEKRRQQIREVAVRCAHFNKVAVVGSSPVDIEAELKIEELAQIVAAAFDFQTSSLRALIERSALLEGARRVLFVINATTPDAVAQARPFINYMRELEVFCIVHTFAHPLVEAWQEYGNTAVFLSPVVSPLLQPLIDAPFFFDLAVALAYARGLSAADVDRPRNLAKSVTTTGAERRARVEARRDFRQVDLTQFQSGRLARVAWDATGGVPSRAALRATVALRAALAVLSDPVPKNLGLSDVEHLVVVTDTEATENGVSMVDVAWQTLLGVDVTGYRRFLLEPPPQPPRTAVLRLVRTGAILALLNDHVIALPADLSPLQQELLTAVYLIGLAVRQARQQGRDTTLWEAGIAQLPLLLADLLTDRRLAAQIRTALAPLVEDGYDKVQIIGGGQDYAAAKSIAHSLRMRGIMAEALYTDSAWHGPLATVGGPDAAHDALIIILATDPLFQAAAMVDTQVYHTRRAHILLVVPRGNETLQVVQDVGAAAILPVPAVPRPFTPIVNAAFGEVMAQQFVELWENEITT